MSHDKFTLEEIKKAFERSQGKCDCCGKTLSFNNQGRDSGRGAWEAHTSTGRVTPAILCTGEPENCHLNCSHDGDYKKPGITPKKHGGRKR